MATTPAFHAYENGDYSLCLQLLQHLQNQQHLSLQDRQLQLMAHIGRLLHTTPTPTSTWAHLLGVSLPNSNSLTTTSTTTTSTAPSSVRFIQSQHRKLAALLHPDKNHHKDASLRFTQLQQGVEAVLRAVGEGGERLSSLSTGTAAGDDDDSWVNDDDNNGGGFPWWSEWDEEEREKQENIDNEEYEEDVIYLESLPLEELKTEVVKRRENVLFDTSKAAQFKLTRARTALSEALKQQQQQAAAARESDQQQQMYGGFFPSSV